MRIGDFPSDGDVFPNFPVYAEYWRNGGIHPIGVAVFPPVFQRTMPHFLLPNGAPELVEHLFSHIWMADDTVRLSKEFFAFVAGYFTEEIVREGYSPGEVCGRDDCRRIHRFPVFLAEVFGSHGMRVQKGDEPFFENPVQYVRLY